MKSTGTVRKIDYLGRVMIPKEVRRSLDIKEGAPLEIYLDNGNIILKKYESISSKKLYTIYEIIHTVVPDSNIAIYNEFGELSYSTSQFKCNLSDMATEGYIRYTLATSKSNQPVGYLLLEGEESPSTMMVRNLLDILV